jgi:hypothetical protein
LQEVSPAQWSDSTLQDYVNEGYRELGDAIKAVDPEWLVYTDTHDIVSGQDLYKFPTSMDSIVELWYRPDTVTAYSRLDFRRRRSQDNDPSGLVGSGVSYSTKGRYFRVDPDEGVEA